MKPRYHLADGVHCSEVDGIFVFLDVHHDRYFALPGEYSYALSLLIFSARDAESADDQAERLAVQLCQRGLLTRAQERQVYKAPVSRPCAHQSIFTEFPPAFHRFRVSDVFNFSRSVWISMLCF